jgi:hypothetical protein
MQRLRIYINSFVEEGCAFGKVRVRVGVRVRDRDRVRVRVRS